MDEITQQQDRITEILRNRTKQPTMQDYNALAAGNMYSPQNFVQQAYQLDQQRQQQALNDEVNILNIFEQRKAQGDAQAKALDEKIKLFAGNDPQGMALFLQELNNDPEDIDPSNSYQIMTKLAQIQKRTGYKNPEMAYEEQKRRLDLAKRTMDMQPKPTGTNAPDFGKAPAGYRYKMDGSLEPIPGGPAEKLPAEMSARLGLANKFLKEAEGIKAGITEGTATGPIDYMAGSMGYGEAGKLTRRIADGADALQRMLTGAGMPASEAADYTARFRVSPQDTAETLLDKVTNLETVLKEQISAATQGRGLPNGQPQAGGQPQGVDPADLEYMTPEERALF